MSRKNKNIVFTNDAQKILDKSTILSDTNSIAEMNIENKSDDTKQSFDPQVNAYVPFYNVELKLYEMFTVQIDPLTGGTKLERKILKTDSEPRAVMEMQKLYANDAYLRMRKSIKKGEK